ncbi:CBS domain-containing protein [Ancylomarina sp. 16SWW S1-10-2]|uniref:CBS domain-containing protein n=1 Tax=Ancylomarina sp. 16SWW S1-10-2 TaxID=2499681 RepID=UPI0012ADF1C1|nr:CBS domain-containing protein [Ancylomarina sp. 16SWW S1-10-2]MRT91955.1 CBS domain-containing protein [Ancylomarina sp. 16SWW S1-10-2]
MGYELWLSSETGERRKGTSFKEIQGLFIDNITTRHIYEPLLSCRPEHEVCYVKHELKCKEFDTAGVIDDNNNLIGYVIREELDDGYIQDYINNIGTEKLISDSTPIAELLNILLENEFIFVIDGSKIEGIVTRADINKPIIRIYLFGILSLFELHLNYWINYYYETEEEWGKILKPKRVEEAEMVFSKRKGNNDELSLLECLQISDKKVILKESEGFRANFNLSKSKIEKLISNNEKIRNELAHSQNSIISNLKWELFVETINHIEQFLIQSEEKHEHTTKDKLNAEF